MFLASLLLLSWMTVFQSETFHRQFEDVHVHASGVLLDVPELGLDIVDGPAATLRPGFREWFGLSYRQGEGSHHYVSGPNEDWKVLLGEERQPGEIQGLEGGEEFVLSVVRCGDLGIRTRFEFDASRSTYLVKVQITNHSSGFLRDVFYSREWFVPGMESWCFPAELSQGLLPDSIGQYVWMLDDMPPGRTDGITFSYRLAQQDRVSQVDVPLVLWTNFDWPTGLPIGETNGISFGDYDADGWIDIFACEGGNLWRNKDGVTWELAADLSGDLLGGIRYGAAFGDYNDDGLPDIGTEPRGTGPFQLFKNLGGGPNFVDVSSDPSIIDVRPCCDSETICWGDVDGDSDLDMLLPVYPAWANNGPGNFFLHNRGPTGPGGEYRFTEESGPVGLDNPPGSARPEGAQFLDVDGDGDLDCYSNGTLYQNRSQFSSPLFAWMTEAASGIGLSTSLDEGAMFFDYDLDGDFDLFVVYTSGGVVLWEAYGDGMYFRGEDDIIDARFEGLNLGMSGEDWDNDGDIDFTTRHVFRRNMYIETGERHFTVATHDIPDEHLVSATPSFGDWDKDGDLDCALGDWTRIGHFYDNGTYGVGTPFDERRHFRVKPVRDSQDVDRGLETEYGAIVELVLREGADSHRRKKFTASGSGYLNQNEYTLHFALPQDPTPGDDNDDLNLDVLVDFPSLPSQGYRRIDGQVNPLLDDLDIATVASREVVVYRSGRVRLDDVDLKPRSAEPGSLLTSTGGLALPTDTVPLSAPLPSPGSDHYVGIELDTSLATAPLLVKELILDGRLDDGVACGADTPNIVFWDITDSASPFVVPNASITEETPARNRRGAWPVSVLLQPSRKYRVVARVVELRGSPINGPVIDGSLKVEGGLSFQDLDPCSGLNVVEALLDSSSVYLSIRFQENYSPWSGFESGLVGTHGIPSLRGTGDLGAGSVVSLNLDDARASSPAVLVIGLSLGLIPAFGGVLFPSADFFVPLMTDDQGEVHLQGVWPSGFPSGQDLFFQAWIEDPVAPEGLAATHGLRATTPHSN